MHKREYLSKLEREILETLSNAKLNNYKNQLYAQKIGAQFTKSYSETYVWGKILLTITQVGILFENEFNVGLCISAFKKCAEILETLGEVSEEYDKYYLTILSSLCYEISGYQANAYCLLKNLDTYSLESSHNEIDLTLDNFVLYQIQQILLKKIPLAYKNTLSNEDKSIGSLLFKRATLKFFENILHGKNDDYLKELAKTHQYFLRSGNVYLSQLLFLLYIRVLKYEKSSIWENLKTISDQNKIIWNKYIKLLTNDIYDDLTIKDEENRNSKFEFWNSQLNAIKSGFLENDESYVVQMPTSSGKTFIAELGILSSLTRYPGSKCLYIAPFRALTNQIERELSANLSKLNYKVSSLSGAYEVDKFQNFTVQSSDVLVATPEKADMLLRMNSEIFSPVSLIIIDEGHIIGNLDTRSSLLEMFIVKIKLKFSKIRFLYMSAVMPEVDTKQFSKWISGNEANYINSTDINNQIWQPTKKLFGLFKWVGNSGYIYYPKENIKENKSEVSLFAPGIISYLQIGKHIFPKEIRDKQKGIKHNKSETTALLALKLSKGGNCLIYCSRPDWVKSVSKSILSVLQNSNDNYFSGGEYIESYHLSRSWFGEKSWQSECLKKKIGMHYGNLPDQLRKAIENDFRNGNLKVLVSTNTIGQGINFPAKYLILHSVLINPKANSKLSIRDFWNIAGRVGRAGKETIGQIIFITDNKKDEDEFYKYTNINNIEKVNSVLFKLLKALIQKRIDETTFNAYIKMVIEPHLLNILAEESLETDDEKIIEEIIQCSLFKVQLLNVNIDPIKNSIRSLIKNIKSKKIDTETIKLFGKTGLSLNSNEIIKEYIKNNLEEFNDLVKKDDFINLLKKISFFFLSGKIGELDIGDKLKIEEENTNQIVNFIIAWTLGESIDNLKRYWPFKNKMEYFISDVFNYKYPWGTTSFLMILSQEIGIEFNELPDNIRNLPTYVKFGTNIDLECFALSLGINNKAVSKLLVGISNADNYKDFAIWLSNVTREDIQQFELNEYDVKNILEISSKISSNETKDKVNNIDFEIKGTYFKKSRRKISLKIKLNEDLILKRDYQNKYDPYAIKVISGKKLIGYVEKNIAKILSIEIDINERKYHAITTKIDVNDFYNKIYAKALVF
ncbi:MAG: DEAD/DEAH box helicase [Clostridia bacterium]|nr:DEAD/DEAH box helicase [Clostridia bacterium]